MERLNIEFAFVHARRRMDDAAFGPVSQTVRANQAESKQG